MIVRKSAPAEEARADEVFAIAFELPLRREKQTAQPGESQRWSAYDTDGEMMSTLVANSYTVRFDGAVLPMAGIGGVATLPQYRRRGGIRGCFGQMLPELYRQGCCLSYLYPFSSAFYRQFGYENCVQKLQVTVDLSQIKKQSLSGCCRMADRHQNLSADIQAVEQVWEQRYNLYVQHSGRAYTWAGKCDPAADQEFTYVYYRADGAPLAYTSFALAVQPDGRNLQCSRFCFADREGFLGLLELLRTLASDHKFAKFIVPGTPAMQYLLPEWSLGAAFWTAAATGMVRVVRVQDVLEQARYLGSGEITLEIRDPQIPENNGRFHVVFRDGKAEAVCRTEESPDVQLTIQAFSALICGVSDFAAARQWMDGIAVCRIDSPADRVFYPKPLMITDYF